MKIIEKDVRKLSAGDLVVAVQQIVKRLNGRTALINTGRCFVLVEEPRKEDGDENVQGI